LAVLGNPDSWYCDRIIVAAQDAGHECYRWNFSQLRAEVSNARSIAIGTTPEEPIVDGVIVRSMPPGSLEQVVFRMDALACLERSNVVVLNSPRSLESAIDKFQTTAKLAEDGLTVPETICCENADAAMEAWERLGRDVLVKPLFGSEGRGIVRVTDPDLAWRAFRTIARLNAVLYLQRFIPNDGSDIRVLVLGNEILGAIRRTATNGFRTNISQPTAIECELALRAATTVGAMFAGVDLMHAEGRTYVIEVNAVPGWRGFQKVTGLPVEKMILAWMKSQIESRRGLGAIPSHATSGA